MKRPISTYLILVMVFITNAFGTDTLKFQPCDDVSVNLFHDYLCFSRSEGTLSRYQDGRLQNVFSARGAGSKITFLDPKTPVWDGSEKVYLLDAGSNTIIGWDRYLNLLSVTPLPQDMISPKAFTVTPEHDWLIYDDFNEQVFQVLPGEGFHTTWGDRPVSGNIELHALDHRVIVFLRDKNIIRICDENGTTLKEFSAPKDIKIRRLFPLQDNTFAISSGTGIFIWKPDDTSFRYLSDMKNTVYAGIQNKSYILIDQNGDVIHIP